MDRFDFIIDGGEDIDRRSLEDDGWGEVVFVVADLEPPEREKPGGGES